MGDLLAKIQNAQVEAAESAVVASLKAKGLLTEERPWRCTRFYPCRHMDAVDCAHDSDLGNGPKVCDCPCHKDFPNCDHKSVGHNDGECCAVCELSEKIGQLEADLAAARAHNLTQQELDEAMAQLLEYNGCRGWEYRDLRDHARGMEEIVRRMLAGEFAEQEEAEAK